MEFIGKTPFGVADTKLTLSSNILGYGADLCDVSGSELVADNLVELCQVISDSSGAVVDCRDMGDDKVWWQAAFRTVKSSTGVDMTKYTIGLENRVNQTLGGIATDEFGRCYRKLVKMVHRLYAAGDAACSGLNGAFRALPGNRLLDALTGGRSAGEHAATWTSKQSFSNTKNLLDSLASCEANFTAKFDSESGDMGINEWGAIDLKLLDIASKYTAGPNDADELSNICNNWKKLKFLLREFSSVNSH